MIPKNIDSNSNIKVKSLNKIKIPQNNEKNSNYIFKNFDNINYIKNKNFVHNIRHNKYLIPLIEKKKTEKNIFKSEIQERPTYIVDFFRKIRKETNSKDIKYNKKDNYTINNNNFDNINNGIINNNIYFKINTVFSPILDLVCPGFCLFWYKN